MSKPKGWEADFNGWSAAKSHLLGEDRKSSGDTLIFITKLRAPKCWKKNPEIYQTVLFTNLNMRLNLKMRIFIEGVSSTEALVLIVLHAFGYL